MAFNKAIIRAFNEELVQEIIVPPHHEVMGAIGAATLASEEIIISGNKTRFKGFEITEKTYQTSSFECANCTNICEIVQISLNGTIIAHYGNRCELWHTSNN